MQPRRYVKPRSRTPALRAANPVEARTEGICPSAMSDKKAAAPGTATAVSQPLHTATRQAPYRHASGKPYSAQRRETWSAMSADMAASGGQRRTTPSPGHFRVASMPILLPAPSAGAA